MRGEDAGHTHTDEQRAEVAAGEEPSGGPVGHHRLVALVLRSEGVPESLVPRGVRALPSVPRRREAPGGRRAAADGRQAAGGREGGVTSHAGANQLSK